MFVHLGLNFCCDIQLRCTPRLDVLSKNVVPLNYVFFPHLRLLSYTSGPFIQAEVNL